MITKYHGGAEEIHVTKHPTPFMVLGVILNVKQRSQAASLYRQLPAVCKRMLIRIQFMKLYTHVISASCLYSRQ